MSSFLKKTADHISIRQTGWLLTTIIVSTGITFMPSLVLNVAGKSAWISIFISGLGGLTLSFIIINTNRFFPEKNLFQYSQVLLGKIFGSFISVLYISILFLGLIVITYEGAKLAEANFIFVHRSPVILAIISYCLAVYMLKGGIGIIARVNDFFIYLVSFLVIILLALNFPFMDLDNILPLTPYGLKTVGASIPLPMLFFAETSLVSVLWAHTREVSLNHRKVFIMFLGCMMTILMLSLLFIIIVATLGEKRAGTLIFPFFTLAREIFYGNYLSNFQILLLPAILILVVIKISIFLFAIESGIIKICGRRFLGFIPYFLCIVTITTTYLTIENQTEMIRLLNAIAKFILPVIVGIHLLLWLVLILRKRYLKQ